MDTQLQQVMHEVREAEIAKGVLNAIRIARCRPMFAVRVPRSTDWTVVYGHAYAIPASPLASGGQCGRNNSALEPLDGVKPRCGPRRVKAPGPLFAGGRLYESSPDGVSHQEDSKLQDMTDTFNVMVETGFDDEE